MYSSRSPNHKPSSVGAACALSHGVNEMPADLQQRLAQPLTVYYALGGTLAYGIDYALIPAPVIANGIFSVQIPAGQTSVPVTIVVTAGVSPRGPRPWS